jgi:outer membrane protein assembly factor BamD
MAEKYYNEGDYKRANRLFEQIAPKYVGKPQGERVMFFFAKTYFETGNYLAGYQFERFIKSYPKSDKIQEASYLEAKNYYKFSPKYTLDQTDTDKALSKLQTFINTYPESEFFADANAMAQELTTKKEKKELEIAKQFTKLGDVYLLDFNIAAKKALDNFVADNPGSEYREEAYYNRIIALYQLAINSTPNRIEERLNDAIIAYNSLMKSYPETKYNKEATALYDKITKRLEGSEESAK